MKKKTILIVGISSFVGSNLAEYFKKDYKVIGTYNTTPVLIPGVSTVKCDILVKENVQLALYALKPDITIFAAGLSSVCDGAEAPGLCEALNTNGLINVTEYCQRYKSKLILISTVYVFSGENKQYMELDIPDANTHYGKSVASAEFYVQKTSLNYLIFRTSLLYGRSLNPFQTTWFEGLQKKLKRNEIVGCDNYIYHGFLDVMYLATIIDLCLNKSVTNRLYQVSSEDVINHYQFAKIYSKIFGAAESNIVKSKWKFPYVVSHTSAFAEGELHFQMDTSNIEGYLNVKLPTVEESLIFTYQRMFGDDLSNKRQKKSEGITFI